MPIKCKDYSCIVAAHDFCLGVVCNNEQIAQIDFLEPVAEATAVLSLAKEAAKQLRAWLADPKFVFDLPLQVQGSAFQRSVWTQISSIPSGQTRSYGQLAQVLNSAPRAVGQACAANPLPVVVPCHRVIAANGGLGGFARQSGGFLLDVKRWLLAHEQGG